MLKHNRLLKNYRKNTAVLMLLIFLMPSLGFGEQPTTPPLNSSESETRYFSDLEIDCLAELDALIDDLSEAAIEAIEQAAGEAARAAALAMLEREAIALREAERWRIDAEAYSQEIAQTRRAGRKNNVIGVLIGIFGGLAVGIGGTLILSR